MSKLVAMHGRDHRVGGADPIPGIGAMAGKQSIYERVNVTAASGSTHGENDASLFTLTEGKDTMGLAGTTVFYANEDGWYEITFKVTGASGFASGKMFRIGIGFVYSLWDGSAWTSIDESVQNSWLSPGSGTLGPYTISTGLRYMRASVNDGLDGTGMFVYQDSGSSLTGMTWDMYVAYFAGSGDL